MPTRVRATDVATTNVYSRHWPLAPFVKQRLAIVMSMMFVLLEGKNMLLFIFSRPKQQFYCYSICARAVHPATHTCRAASTLCDLEEKWFVVSI
jgi:hypothetical protein